jgi:hypothetical protein
MACANKNNVFRVNKSTANSRHEVSYKIARPAGCKNKTCYF